MIILVSIQINRCDWTHWEITELLKKTWEYQEWYLIVIWNSSKNSFEFISIFGWNNEKDKDCQKWAYFCCYFLKIFIYVQEIFDIHFAPSFRQKISLGMHKIHEIYYTFLGIRVKPFISGISHFLKNLTSKPCVGKTCVFQIYEFNRFDHSR